MGSQIVIIDDDALVRESLKDVLSDEGHSVSAYSTLDQARPILEAGGVSAVLLDVWLENQDGLDLLPFILQSSSEPSVIMISGHASVDSAVKATKRGAYDFLEKPISIDRLTLTLSRAIESRELRMENRHLKASGSKVQLFGQSKVIQELRQTVRVLGKSQSAVLICGENGSGKEVVARLLHQASNRADQPFVAVNCAAIPESLIESELFGYEKGAFTGATQARMGKIESAHLGTLFLDEIGDLSLSAQAKLLRVIQEKTIFRLGSPKEIPVNLRWLAATNKDLDQMVREKLFREDLFYRLNVIRLDVAPLRERKEDVEILADQFLRTACSDMEVSLKILDPKAIEKLSTYNWPGNVRELKNVIERAVALSLTDQIGENDIQFSRTRETSAGERPEVNSLLEKSSFKEARSEFERLFLQSHLSKYGSNVTKLANHIGLERSYLYRKLKQHELGGEM